MSASIGLRYSLVGLGMADADAEQEAAGVGLVDAVKRLRDGPGCGRPDVDDPGGDLQRRGLREDRFHPRQVAAAGEPPTQMAP